MNCQRCSDWFIKKLGRCHACMLQSALLFLISLSIWLLIEEQRSVEAIAALFFAITAGCLFSLHILVWLVRHLSRTADVKDDR